MKYKILLSTFLLLLAFISALEADTVYLKNGRSMEGLVKKETEETVELDLGFGSVKFRKDEIERIDISEPGEVGAIHQEWQRQEKIEEEKRLKRKNKREEASREKELEPNEVEISEKGGHIFVNALLNDKVNASFVLDTGSPYVLLSDRMVKKMGIKTRGAEIWKVKLGAWTDVPEMRVVPVVLDSINLQGIEARDVEAVVSLDETPGYLEDGLLGMSFLSRFNFQIDTVSKKLILKRRPR